MARRLVLQNEIDQQYNSFRELAINFSDCSKKIIAKLLLISGSYRRSGGQTTVIAACRAEINSLIELTQALKDGAKLMKLSRDTFRNLDDTIRDEINKKEFYALDTLSYGDTGSSSRVVPLFADSFNGENYYTIDYKSFIMSQNDPDINRDGYMNVDGISMGCTITCMAMLLSIITGTFHDPTEFALDYNADYPAASNINAVWGRAVDMSGYMYPGDVYSTAYSQLLSGYPSIIYADRGTGPHAVLVTGVREGADPNNLSASDFLVVDPWDGATKSLADIGYNGNLKIGTYNGCCG